MRFLLIVLSLIFISCKNEKPNQVSSCSEWPKSEITDSTEVDPYALAEAKVCGTLKLWGGQFPKSLNSWLDYNSFSAQVMSLFYETLIEFHPKENKAVGVLAKTWEQSEDGMEFVFHIRPEATWSDGTPISAQDIQFYYDVIMKPENLTPIFRVGLERFERPEIIDIKTVKIKAKEKHWKNFWEVGSFSALPKHKWENLDFNKINFEFDVVSGPYKMGELKKERSLELIRRKDWWGDHLLFNQNKFNFEKIKYRFIADRTKSLESLKKEDFDALPIYTSSIWAMQTQFEQVEKNWIVRQEIYNSEPLGYQGMAMNLRKEKFQDLNVRQALAYLLNREQMNEKLMYNAYFLLNSYFPDLYENKTNPNVELTAYNPEKARALLKEAGYVVNAQGLLEKNGKVLEISFLTAATDLRHLTIYLEDMKAVGIDAKIEKMTWSTIRKKLDEHDFDMYWIAWGASRLRDPEAAWSSKQAMEKGSNNIPGYANAKVDEILEILKTEQDLNKRDSLLVVMDEILVRDMPYVLLWQKQYHRLLYWNRFDTPKGLYTRFGDESSMIAYWAFNEQKDAALKAAQKANQSLNSEPGKVTAD